MKSLLLPLYYFAAVLIIIDCTGSIAHADFWQHTGGPQGGIINEISTNSVSDIFLATNGGVFRSIDNGENWTAVVNGLTDYQVKTILVDSINQLFAGFTYAGVFRSTDNGESWWEVNEGLTNKNVISLTICSSNGLFAGSYQGAVFRSIDHGENWSAINSGLLNKYVSSIAVDSSDFVFAGTYGNGVFRSVESITALEKIHTGISGSFVLEQNYPNPFNPRIRIRFNLNVPGNVEISVFNMLGQRITTLLDEKKTPGTYSIDFNADGLSSGIYYYTITMNGYSNTKKILYIR